MERKDFFTRGILSLFGELLDTPIGGMIDRRLEGFSNLLAPEWISSGAFYRASQSVRICATPPRPPGAVDPDLFDSICSDCGDCIRACPHGTLLRTEDIRGPILDPNINPCRLCSDYPCIRACEPKALKRLSRNTIPWFGSATVQASICINGSDLENGISSTDERCEGCVRACPVPDAIHLAENGEPEFADHCTGCGMCAYVCPVSAIRIET
jgi:ferredoxin